MYSTVILRMLNTTNIKNKNFLWFSEAVRLCLFGPKRLFKTSTLKSTSKSTIILVVYMCKELTNIRTFTVIKQQSNIHCSATDSPVSPVLFRKLGINSN